MINDNALINQIAGFATIAICIMTAISFLISIGAWEAPFWISDIDDVDGQWGEDIVVVYTDGTTESVKGISNNYWSTMSIQNDGSKPIEMLQYCLNAKIPTSDSFDITGYECTVSVVDQDNIILYHTTHTYVNSVSIEANQWVRIVTVSLDIESISEGLNDGFYTVSFENAGAIKGISIPDIRSIDITITESVVRFLI